MLNKYLLPIVFLVLPFSVLSFGLIHQGHHFGIMVAGIVMLAVLSPNRWLKAFLGYVAVWQIALFVIVMKFNLPSQELVNSIMFMLFLFAGGVIYLAAYHSTLKLERFYDLFCVAALIQSAIALMQFFFSFDPFLYVLSFFVKASTQLGDSAVCGTLGNPNFIAAFLAISLPFFFRKKWCYGLIPVALVLVVSKSSTGAVPAIVGAVFYFGGLKYLALAVFPVIAYLIYDIPSYVQIDLSVLHTRAEIWADVFNKITSQSWVNLLFGRGNAAYYGRLYPMHNEILQCLYQYGLVGMAMVCGYVVTIYRGNRMLFTAFLIAVINCFGNYPLHLAPSAFLVLIILGLIERERGNA